MNFTRRRVLKTAAGAGSVTLIGLRGAEAASEAAQIDHDATAALNRLYHLDRRAASLRGKATGILVFPRIVKAGFVFGGQGGKGVLLVGGHPQRYYTIAAASFGLQAGVQWFSYALFFMNQPALRYLDQSDGWAVGTDPNVVVVNRGLANTINSTTLARDVVAFPFGQNGLMADISLQGSKITTYNPSA
jgi:lipid-binding SYLF domain-containing protein